MADNNIRMGGSPLDLNICGLCGRAFVGKSGSNDVCDNCREEEREIYAQVRDLIRDNPGRAITVEEASRLLHISEKKIQHLVNKGMVQLGSALSNLRSLF